MRVKKCRQKLCDCVNCKQKEYRAKNIEKYTYNNLRNNAKRRGKEFNLTFEEFLEFAIRAKYFVGKGIFKDSLHIDREDETKGYVFSNLQVLANSKNVKKFLTYKYGPTGKPEDFEVKTYKPTDYPDTPF